MTTATVYPRIQSVDPKSGKTLLVRFVNGDQKVYDCTPLLQTEAFRPLQDEVIFRCAYADPHGYGVIWNDEIDLAESEIWINGRTVEQANPCD
ncbi:Protein of unknown function [Desulfonatronum zhilinae]|nr:Protein of unknown function [Desulfonatronum zhilinae]